MGGHCRIFESSEDRKYFEIAGTTAVKDGKPYAAGNAYEQTKYILENIKRFLKRKDWG